MSRAVRLKRLLGRVDDLTTPLLLGTEALILAGGVLLVIDQSLRGNALVAVALSCLTAAAGLLAWKLHTTGIAVSQARRRIKQLAAAQKVTHSAPKAAKTQEDPREKLRTVGSHTPEKTDGAGAGRLAASVSADPDAPFRLFVATQRTSGSAQVGRSLALIGSDRLAESLAGHGTVHRLHPSMTRAEFVNAEPEVLIIEEDALEAGAWTGALAPHGSNLLRELRVAMASIRAVEGFIYVIPAGGMPGPAAEALRADTVLVDDGFIARYTAEGTPDSLMKTLGRYRNGEGAAQ